MCEDCSKVKVAKLRPLMNICQTLAEAAGNRGCVTSLCNWEKAIPGGGWHHPDMISLGSKDSKTMIISNTYFLRVQKKSLVFLLTIKGT